jgi:hypothetical protein
MNDYKVADKFGPVFCRHLGIFLAVYEIKAEPAYNKVNEYNKINIENHSIFI